MLLPSLILIMLLCLSSQQVSQDIFVTAEQNCGAHCQGNISQPYDNLLFALQAASSLQSATIIILRNSSLSHFVLKAELNSTANSEGSQTNSTQRILQSGTGEAGSGSGTDTGETGTNSTTNSTDTGGTGTNSTTNSTDTGGTGTNSTTNSTDTGGTGTNSTTNSTDTGGTGTNSTTNSTDTGGTGTNSTTNSTNTGGTGTNSTTNSTNTGTNSTGSGNGTDTITNSKWLYTFPDPVVFILQNVTITPLFCDDTVRRNSVPRFSDQCISRDQKLTIYLKSLLIMLNIQGNLTIQNIIFDGLESVSDYRSSTTSINLTSCNSTRTNCCPVKGTSDCKPESFISSSPKIDSLFNLNSAVLNQSVAKRSLVLSNVEFQNFWSPSLKSLIQTGNYTFDLNLTKCVINDVFFSKGLIYHTDSSNSATNNALISLNNLQFSNYNYWNQIWSSSFTSVKEGYLLYVEDAFRGSIQITKSVFSNLNAASKDRCLNVENSSGFALNNLLSSQPGSRSDLWSLYNRISLNLNFMSSMIYIKKIQGELLITDSTFQNIIGTTGSVIRVDDFQPVIQGNRVQVQSSTFDGNFGMDGFSNIMIAKKSFSASKLSIDDCPTIKVDNSTFNKAAGCPGSYGNVGFICYWSSQPSSKPPLSNYDYFTVFNASKLSSPSDQALVRVTNSVFQNNLLSVSNSLAIIGSYFTLLQNNTFKDNGGTTAELVNTTLKNSYFLTKKPNQDSASLYSFKHFGQSTAVYLDRIIKLQSNNNTFKGNWGPWEGSQSLASSLTIKNWLNVPNSLNLMNDLFIDHNGIPASLAANLTDTGLKNGVVTEPIIAISYDEEGTRVVQNLGSSGVSAGNSINFSAVKFKNNTASYDYAKYKYNLQETMRITSLMLNDRKYKLSFLKFLSPSEIIDEVPYNHLITHSAYNKVGFSFTGGEISNNSLLTEGCLFPTLLVETFLLNDLLISENSLYSARKALDQSDKVSRPILDQPMQNRDGMFCVFAQESFDIVKNTSIIAAKLRVRNNNGIIFNLYPENSGRLFITGSVFINGQCNYLSPIVAFKDSSVISLNNLFLQNSNALGTIFLAANAKYTGVCSTYAKNKGIHASLIYFNGDSKPQSFEVSTKTYWNSINPSNKFFIDKLTPQSGLYFSTSSELAIVGATFKENTIYAGLVVSLGSTISFVSTTITNHNVTGSGLIGVFIESSALTIKQTKLINNSIIRDPLLPFSYPIMMNLTNSKLDIDSFEISQIQNGNQATMISGTALTGQWKNVTIDSFILTPGNTLINFISSDVSITNLTCNNITNLFDLSKTKLSLNSFSVKNFKIESNSQFLMRLFDTTLKMANLQYVGGSDAKDSVSLFNGGNNYVQINGAKFTDAVDGKSKIFDLKDSKLFLIKKGYFEYSKGYRNLQVFSLSSPQRVIIEQCVFRSVGQVIEADNILQEIFFLNNAILTDSHLQNIKITKSNTSLFVNNHVVRKMNASLQLSPQSQIQIQDPLNAVTSKRNVFFSLCGTNGIFEVQAQTIPYNFNSSYDVFINNTASLGGALHLYAATPSILKSPTVNIQKAIFTANSALNSNGKAGKGGAIYQTTPSDASIQVTSVKESHFLANTAGTIGGAVFFDFMPLDIDIKSKFVRNYATRINHIASYPVKLGYSENNQYNTIYSPGTQFLPVIQPIKYNWNNVTSGDMDETNYTFALLDQYNQVYYDDNSSLLEIYPEGLTDTEKTQFSNKGTVKAENGLYKLNEIRLRYKINETIDVSFTSSAIPAQRTIPLNVPLTLTKSIQIAINFRDCKLGEHVTRVGNFTICEECLPGFWQLNKNSDPYSCDMCDHTSTFCLGGSRIGPKKGYWRLDQNADLVLKCPIENSCLGNELTDYQSVQKLDPLGQCGIGHKGNLCANCINGWAKTLNGPCTECTRDAGYYIKIVLSVLFCLLLIACAVKGTTALSEKYITNEPTKTSGAVLMRILINYLQLVFLIGTIPAPWPNALRNLLYANSIVSSLNERILELDCTYNTDPIHTIQTIFLKLLLGVLVNTSTLIILSVIFWIMYFKIQKEPLFNRRFVSRIVTTIIVIFFTMQPTAVKVGFSMFHCSNLYRTDQSIDFLVADYDTKCWEGDHPGWTFGLALPGLILWAIILPLIILILLFKIRRNLKDELIAPKYSFLYGGYVASKYYWEWMITVRKIFLIVLIFGAGFHSTDLQIYLSILLIFVSLLLQIAKNPFEGHLLNHLEQVSLVSVGIILLCGLYFQLVSSPKGIDTIVIIIGIAANVIFFLYLARVYFSEFITRLAQTKLVSRIKSELSCCLTFTTQKKRKSVTDKNPDDSLRMNKEELKRFAKILFARPSSSVLGSEFDAEIETLVKLAKNKQDPGTLNLSKYGGASKDTSPKLLSNSPERATRRLSFEIKPEHHHHSQKKKDASFLNIEDIMVYPPRNADSSSEVPEQTPTYSNKERRRSAIGSEEKLFPLDISQIMKQPTIKNNTIEDYDQ